MQPSTESRAAPAAEPPDRRTGTRIARASCLPVTAALAAALVLFAGALYAPEPDDPVSGAALRLAEAIGRGATPPPTPVADDCPREADDLAPDVHLVVLREAAPPPSPPRDSHSTAPPVPTI